MEWRIFFIGPMSGTQADHIPRLRAHVVQRMLEVHGYTRVENHPVEGVLLTKGDDQITLAIPAEQGMLRDITTNVFHQIDSADLLIADLSDNRPAVVYELGMAHGLGIDTILIGGPETNVFYLSHIRYNVIDFNNPELKSETFDQGIDVWLRERSKSRSAANPLYDFYDAAMVDISAASGLALGYFDNFATPIFLHGEIVQRFAPRGWWLFRRTPDDIVSPVRGIIVARPDTLFASVQSVADKLDEELHKHFGEAVLRGDPKSVFVRIRSERAAAEEQASAKKKSAKKPTSENIRTSFFVVENYVIDIPRTMFSLQKSKRLVRITDKLKKPSEAPVVRTMQNVLMDCFFSNLRTNLEDHRRKYTQYEAQLHVGTVAQIPDIIKTGQSPKFSP